jgi:hypothetical protein
MFSQTHHFFWFYVYVGLDEKVFNQPFFAYGEKRLGMLVLGFRPKPQLIY